MELKIVNPDERANVLTAFGISPDRQVELVKKTQELYDAVPTEERADVHLPNFCVQVGAVCNSPEEAVGLFMMLPGLLGKFQAIRSLTKLLEEVDEMK